MAYADYQFYTESFYGNSVKSEDFSRLAERASEIIDSMTYYRINNDFISRHDTLVKKACCAVAEFLNNVETVQRSITSDNKIVISESAGNISQTYANPTAAYAEYLTDENKKNSEIYEIIRKYLSHTGILNRSADVVYRR
ncbi:MAG: hypothetical protein ACI4JM_05215 [Oscillospiraceae bacterium]